jgi:MYXO-CTERM domain-containing protein
LGNNVAIDNLALNGNITAVPEPGSTGVVVAAAALVLGAARGLRRPR